MEVAPSGPPTVAPPREVAPKASAAHVERPEKPTKIDRAEAPEGTPEGAPDGVPSSLKFTISAADVDATFAIHEELRRVMVTMTDSTSGEVLRQIPPQAVLDTMLALRHNGMMVDVTS